jgi:protein-S-isoprenylcysteine O-methyltransferase Ste14
LWEFLEMGRVLAVLYGVVAYAFFFATFVYAILFIEDIVVPKTIDSGAAGPIADAVLVNLALLGLFAVQHSVMARPAFKRWWTRFVPEAIERSTYVLFATAALALLCWQWQPIPQPVWTVEHPVAVAVLIAVSWAGWGVLLFSTFLINHFELFGLRQVFLHLVGRRAPAPQFRTPLLYRVVRHPLYLGFMMAFWATPRMTMGHLLFAGGSTLYILIGIQLEERDLTAVFGDRYRRYRAQVGMILPWPGRRADLDDTGRLSRGPAE